MRGGPLSAYISFSRASEEKESGVQFHFQHLLEICVGHTDAEFGNITLESLLNN